MPSQVFVVFGESVSSDFLFLTAQNKSAHSNLNEHFCLLFGLLIMLFVVLYSLGGTVKLLLYESKAYVR